MKFAYTLVAVLMNAVMATSYAQNAPTIVTPDKIEFRSRPNSPASAVLYGNPAGPGVYVQRVKLAKNEKILPHTHPDDRTVIVLSGTMYVGFGDQFDEGKLLALPPGSFFTEPGNLPHYNWAKDDEVIVQVTGTGPSAPVPFKR